MVSVSVTQKHINVTQKHIENGRPFDPCCCPVSLAIADAIGQQLCVSREFAYCDDDSSVRLPSEVAGFIDDFDSGLPVAPFTFTLNVP